MSNPYDPPQTKECRGWCGDSGCPHKPPRFPTKWWHEPLAGAIVLLTLAACLAAFGYILEVDAFRKLNGIKL